MIALRSFKPVAMLRRSLPSTIISSTQSNVAICGSPEARQFTCPAVRRHAAKQKVTAKLHVQSAADAPVAMPSLDMAKAMPLNCIDMDNASLLTLAALDVEDARAEVLKRHIMSTDNAPYERACATFDEIAAFNEKGMFKHTIPYKIGITASLGGAFASIPLCFHFPSVNWFNENFVTADVPEPKDLETWLEVGAWSWNWMEPPLGQISFFLLCLQFARSQIQNLGLRPYTAKIKDVRAERVVAKFSRYDPKILSDYSRSVDYYY